MGIKFENIQDAKTRLWDDIVTHLPTGEVTNIQGWKEREDGQALALVSLSTGGGAVPSTEFGEFSYEDALDTLAKGRR